MNKAKDILTVVGILALIIIILVSAIAIDKIRWNNGQCKCGGNWEFTNASREKNVSHYYYHCNKCGDVIRLNHTPHK